MRLERVTPDEWRRALPEDAEVFHHPEALSVLDDHAPGDLRLYAGYKGHRPVGLFPAFVRDVGPVRMVTSPPPGFSVPRLGPLVMPASPKRSKRERVTRRFVSAVLDDVGTDRFRTLFRATCSPAFPDPRPFGWADERVEPWFTYHLPVDDTDTVMAGFSSSLRREIRNGNTRVEREGIGSAKRVFDELAARYERQDESFPLSWPYVRELVGALGDRARVYVARDDRGAYQGGLIALYSDREAYFWLGGTRSENGVTASLHWEVIRDVAEDPPVESVSAYDLVGANTERLCRYKAKFGAELRPYYVVESSGPVMNAAKRLYETVR